MVTMSYDTSKVLAQYEKHFGYLVPGDHTSEALFFEVLVFNMHIPAQAAQEIIKEAIKLKS